MTLILITVGLIALIMLAMSVGVVLKGRCLRGSCGGPEILDPNGDPLSCATCPNRNKAAEDKAAENKAEGKRPVRARL